MKTRLFKATEKGLLGVCVLSHGIVKAVEKIEEASFNKEAACSCHEANLALACSKVN